VNLVVLDQAVEAQNEKHNRNGKKKITSAITFKGYTVRASKEEPQYLIKSDTTDHLAMHKGSALKKLKSKQ
jgi:hypothetical protein